MIHENLNSLDSPLQSSSMLAIDALSYGASFAVELIDSASSLMESVPALTKAPAGALKDR